MIAGFFYDERFTRDASGTYYGSGAVPYRAFAQYLEHFDRMVVVGRLGKLDGMIRGTRASGEGIDWACIENAQNSRVRYLGVAARRVREVLSRVDCAIVRTPGFIGPIACREALRSGTPLLVEVVADALETLWFHGSWMGKLAALPMYLLNRHYIGRAGFAIYVTRTTLQRRYPPGGAWVAASDVILDPPDPDVLARRLVRIEARGPGAPAILGLVGSYDVDYKGHETALRALSLLSRAGRAVTLRCIGVGDPTRWRARAAALGVERWVDLGGALPHGAPVTEWMDGLDACIVPSRTEGLPRGLVEAMSRALPAVASRVGGIPDLLEARWLHPPRDHRALAGLLAALLDRRAEMEAQARRNWHVAAEYAADILETRRDRLVQQFKASVVPKARAGDRATRVCAS